jgi:hypothetical protein
MKRFQQQQKQANSNLFGLTEDSIAFRNKRRGQANAVVWFILSGMTMVSYIFLMEDNLDRIVVIGLSLIKYLPLIAVLYSTARNKAAAYLTDVYELKDENDQKDENIAAEFIDSVAFGFEKDIKITINEGKISGKDELSPIILIGGPGMVQVNLDSVALLERVDGTPEIIEPRGQPWHIGPFERIREIGKSDEVGKREYAIINLRDQFVRGLTVRARTKDGIPIEAQDIKVIFSILRKPKNEQNANNPYNYDEKAVYSLIYNQAIITPPPKPMGVSFPWDTTVIPLVTGELEKLITTHNLSEILASISARELDTINQTEVLNTQMRLELTGAQTTVSVPGNSKTPNFESRTKITSIFFSDEFKGKAEKIGVSLHWIDIGTWQLPSDIIIEEFKNARQMMHNNASKLQSVKNSGKRFEAQGFLDQIGNVIVESYSRSSSSSSSRKLSEKEYLELMKMMEDNPDIAHSPMLQQRFNYNAASKRDSNSTAIEILKAFRRELVIARELIEKENSSPIEKQVDLARIDKALRDIDHHVSVTKKVNPK